MSRIGLQRPRSDESGHEELGLDWIGGLNRGGGTANSRRWKDGWRIGPERLELD